MDQDPTVAGGANLDNLGTDNTMRNEPGQNTQDSTNINSAGIEPASTMGQLAEHPAAGQGHISSNSENSDPTTPTSLSNSEFTGTQPTAQVSAQPVSQPQPTSQVATQPLDNQASTQPVAQAAGQTIAQPQVARPADSHHIEHDLRLPGDKQKRRLQIIIASVVGALVVLIAGFAVWFAVFYNQPDKVMLDSINNVFRAKNIALNGGGSIMLYDNESETSASDDYEPQSIMLNFDSASTSLPNATNASLLITFANDKQFNIQLSSVIMTDGEIYLQVSGLMDSLRDLGALPAAWDELDDDYSAASNASTQNLSNIIETIDGEWWRISIPDVLEETLGDQNEIASLYGDLYDCAINASMRDESKELVELYTKNKFVKVTPVQKIASPDGYVDYRAQAWHNLYEIEFDKTSLASFLNAIPETDAAQEMYACYNTALKKYYPNAEELSASDASEVTADDIDIPEDLHLYAEVSQFGHKLRSIWAYSDDEDLGGNAFSVLLEYRDAEVAAPSEYRNITDLFKELGGLDGLTDIIDNPSSSDPITCNCVSYSGNGCDCVVIDDDDLWSDEDDIMWDEYWDDLEEEEEDWV